jgi:N-6 DNA methylase
LQPQVDDNGNIVVDKKGRPVSDKEKTDTEIIPFTYPGGIEGFMDAEVRPYAPDAWVDKKKIQIGYELSFTKYFYKHVTLRGLDDIVSDLRNVEAETEGILSTIVEGR